MKNILCFGDSNTFGAHPLGGRHPYYKRFTGRMQMILGPEYRIIEEGLSGRTSLFTDEIEPFRSAQMDLHAVIDTHVPIDLIIVMLGTNDMKRRFHLNLWDMQQSMEAILRMILSHPYAPFYKQPEILVVSPIHIGDDIENSCFGAFDRASVEKSHHFAEAYEKAAALYGAHFFDAASVASPSKEDQLHMDAASHAALAEALTEQVKSILDEAI